MTLNCELCQNEFSVSSGRLVIKFPKIYYLCTYVDQGIIQQRFNFLLQLQFYNISTNVLSIIFKLFPDILTIYEPRKKYNKVPKYCQTLALIIIYQPNSMSQRYLDFQ